MSDTITILNSYQERQIVILPYPKISNESFTHISSGFLNQGYNYATTLPSQGLASLLTHSIQPLQEKNLFMKPTEL